ncbi:hypothetical protein NBRC110019_09970 [Neptunitalea chrysea]|uniref:Endoglucanase n=1 Tax=Neptunitalea chrysea TaxID=1647581 RepID=A0A9W6B751_9FLAO|nr:cellulase family glycosylhydrolase [Neptunitalea chrysea]GLB51958.1 hypothetical protein NBRC110019_09970 [Neptunitalea chrysea]
MKAIYKLLSLTMVFTLFIGVMYSCDDDNDINTADFSIDVTEMTFEQPGGTNTVEITALPYTTWGISTDAEWLTITDDLGATTSEGRDSATITVTASFNSEEAERTAIITVYTFNKSYTINVTQDYSSSNIANDSSNMSDYTAVELTAQLGLGWNVGNSLESTGGETAWGNPLITKELIDAVKDAGFTTVRIPVGWSNYIEDGDDNYTISAAGFARVEEVVNYVLDNDMYAIINIHWDGGWMQPTYDDQDYVNDRLTKMWKQIAIYFRDYDYHLIFAGTNEVMVDGDYGEPTEEYYTVQNSFNETFMNTVRATGGRNYYRYLTIQGFNTNIDYTVAYATLPTDVVSNRMLMEVHYYDPYNFTINEDDTIWQWGQNTTDPSANDGWGDETYVDAQFQKMKTNFVDQGIGVILGEYGAMARTNVTGSEAFRSDYLSYVTASAFSHDLTPVYWDNGGTGDHGMGLFERSTATQAYPDIISAMTNSIP